jgi:hypothetical protein
VDSAPAQVNGESGQTKIAGQAVHPDKAYSEWIQAQSNPDLKPEDKIKSTVNAFFIIKYDSWVQGTLLDFGFLFAQTDPQAYEDYAYERGLMHYLLEGWKYGNNLLLSYEYQPKFYDLKVNDQEATVVMRPKAGIVHRKMPQRVHNGPWTDYVFSLELTGGQWLIRKVLCNDENHEIYPHGTDFGQLAADLPDRLKEYNARVAQAEVEHRERMQKDPEYRKFIEGREKMRQERLNAPKIEPERLEFYNKISGYYEAGKKLVLFIYVHNNRLMARWKHDPEGEIMQQTGTSQYEFSLNSKNGQTYHLKFIIDDENRTIKCLIQNGKLELETTKIDPGRSMTFKYGGRGIGWFCLMPSSGGNVYGNMSRPRTSSRFIFHERGTS